MDGPVWRKENWLTFSLCLGWCVMMYHDIQPFIEVLTPLSTHQWVHMCEVDTLLYKQPSKGITYILASYYFKDGLA